MDMMQIEPWRTVVTHLVEDQGDMPMPATFEYSYLDRDRVAAERWLKRLCPKHLKAFCVADQVEIGHMIRAGGEDAKRAHEIVDDLYLLVLGEAV